MNRQNKDFIQVGSFYGTLQPYQDYEVIEEGFDWFRVKNGTYVPKSIIRRPGDKDPRRFERQYDNEDEEYGAIR